MRPNLRVVANYEGESITIVPRPTDKELRDAGKLLQCLTHGTEHPPIKVRYELTGDYRTPKVDEYYWFWCGAVHTEHEQNANSLRWNRKGKAVRCNGLARQRFHILRRVEVRPIDLTQSPPVAKAPPVCAVNKELEQLELRITSIDRKVDLLTEKLLRGPVCAKASSTDWAYEPVGDAP